MNLLIAEKSDFTAPGRITVRGRRFEHLKNVLKITGGGLCRCGELNGLRGTGRIERMGDDFAEISLSLAEAPPPALPCEVVMALPRPKTLRKAVHCAVSFGVKKIHFIQTFKVEKSYWDSPRLKADFLHEEMLLGLEQSGDTVAAEFYFHRQFRPFAEDKLPQMAAESGAVIIAAHPGEAERFSRVKTAGRPCILVLGPEGGFTDFEVNMLRRAGAETVNIGERILRTEFALAKLLSVF